jgi:hypothetical protein
MQGNNTMELNEATMIEALQFWLDKKMFRGDAAPKVTAVKPGTSDRYCTTFNVETTDRAAS